MLHFEVEDIFYLSGGHTTFVGALREGGREVRIPRTKTDAVSEGKILCSFELTGEMMLSPPSKTRLRSISTMEKLPVDLREFLQNDLVLLIHQEGEGTFGSALA